MPDAPSDSKAPTSASLVQRLAAKRDEYQHVLRVVDAGLRGLYRSHLPRMAAALAYRTLFSIIPLFVIGLLVLRAFVTPDEVEASLNKLLQFTGVTQIETVGEAAGADPDPVDRTQDASDARIKAQGVEEFITGLTQRVGQAVEQPNAAAIGLVSVLILVYAALSMIIELERSFNNIYRAPGGRSWGRRITLYWTMLTLGSLVLTLSFAAGESVTGMVGRLSETVNVGVAVPLGVAGFFVTVAISTGLLTYVYTTLPNTKVAFRSALIGAVLAAVLWELGKWGFTRYIAATTSYERFYGSLAALPLFMLWVYLTWMIVLFGLQVSYALQHRDQWGAMEQDDADDQLVDTSAGLLAALAVARGFASGRATTLGDVASAAGVHEDAAARVLDRLADASVVVRTEEAGYTLARPAEAIPAVEALDATDPALGRAGDADTRAIQDTLLDAKRQTLGRRTLADLIEIASVDTSRSETGIPSSGQTRPA